VWIFKRGSKYCHLHLAPIPVLEQHGMDMVSVVGKAALLYGSMVTNFLLWKDITLSGSTGCKLKKIRGKMVLFCSLYHHIALADPIFSKES